MKDRLESSRNGEAAETIVDHQAHRYTFMSVYATIRLMQWYMLPPLY